jgi:hypothetical protein
MGRRDTSGFKDAQDERAACRSFVSLPLAQLVPPITRTAFRARSPAGADLMAHWSAIVGPRLADQTVPRKLSRGQLTIACSGPVGMELQHAAAALIERINVQTGTRLVERLRFVQAPVTARPPTLPMNTQSAAEPMEALPRGPLNEALAALGATLRKARAK